MLHDFHDAFFKPICVMEIHIFDHSFVRKRYTIWHSFDGHETSAKSWNVLTFRKGPSYFENAQLRCVFEFAFLRVCIYKQYFRWWIFTLKFLRSRIDFLVTQKTLIFSVFCVHDLVDYRLDHTCSKKFHLDIENQYIRCVGRVIVRFKFFGITFIRQIGGRFFIV